MFFKKAEKKPFKFPRLMGEVPWDDKTTQWLADQDRFDVKIVNCIRTKTTGHWRPDQEMRNSLSYDAEGHMRAPKFILASIGWEEDREHFGGFKYNSMEVDVRGKILNVPLLEMWVTQEGMKEIHDAHRDALLCGRRHSNVRFWKKKSDGLMTALDKEHGHSYESNWPVFGIITWSELMSTKLPKWAVPLGHHNFSLDTLPEYLSDLEL